MERTSVNGTNEAANRLAETAWDSYKTLMQHAISLQESNAKLVAEMVDASIKELHRQAESNLTLTRELAEQAEEHREAFQELLGKSIFDAYVNFFFAPFSYQREELESPAPRSAESGGNGSLPLKNYDELTVEEVSRKLTDLTAQDVQAIRSHEKRHKNRETLLERLDRALV